jgi:hypothetical protein
LFHVAPWQKNESLTAGGGMACFAETSAGQSNDQPEKIPMLPNIWFVLKHVLVRLVVMVAVTAPWSLIAVANVRLSPQVPWAIPVMVVYIGAVMAYLQGRGWPVTTAETRRRSFRARLTNRTEFFWSFVVGDTPDVRQNNSKEANDDDSIFCFSRL